MSCDAWNNMRDEDRVKAIDDTLTATIPDPNERAIAMTLSYRPLDFESLLLNSTGVRALWNTDKKRLLETYLPHSLLSASLKTAVRIHELTKNPKMTPEELIATGANIWSLKRMDEDQLETLWRLYLEIRPVVEDSMTQVWMKKRHNAPVKATWARTMQKWWQQSRSATGRNGWIYRPNCRDWFLGVRANLERYLYAGFMELKLFLLLYPDIRTKDPWTDDYYDNMKSLGWAKMVGIDLYDEQSQSIATERAVIKMMLVATVLKHHVVQFTDEVRNWKLKIDRATALVSLGPKNGRLLSDKLYAKIYNIATTFTEKFDNGEHKYGFTFEVAERDPQRVSYVAEAAKYRNAIPWDYNECALLWKLRRIACAWIIALAAALEGKLADEPDLDLPGLHGWDENSIYPGPEYAMIKEKLIIANDWFHITAGLTEEAQENPEEEPHPLAAWKLSQVLGPRVDVVETQDEILEETSWTRMSPRNDWVGWQDKILEETRWTRMGAQCDCIGEEDVLAWWNCWVTQHWLSLGRRIAPPLRSSEMWCPHMWCSRSGFPMDAVDSD